MAEQIQTAAAFRDPPPFAVEAVGLSLEFLPGGPDRLEHLLAMIDGARASLKMVFYIFECDASGGRVRDALAAAAGRGVDVCVIVDGFGANAEEEWFAPLVEAGGTFLRFHPKWTRRYLIRNHQKMVIADGRLAMMGGFNVSDAYFASPEAEGWNDLAFTIEGPVVARIEEWFGQLEDWVARPRAQFLAIRRAVREWDAGTGPVRLLIGGPTRGLSTWARAVGEDLIHCRRMDMMMAYFTPPRRLRRRMRQVASHGQTRLLMAGKSDNGATIGASRLLYRRLLKAGAKIWEFQPTKLHTKLIVLDDAVYLGSANFDMRSLYLNLEIVLRIEDAGLAERMRAHIDHHIAASEAITPQVLAAKGGGLTRLKWMASWLLVGVIDYTVSRRLNLGL
ncbi:phosphatidylserine/phosphatidylglycerophosphate/cardiolipin synthase family protein [Altererythrobacter sp. KTW20L]|uniref:phospholipase D-like domain-containing protein n=1 Tax=Altererythrobacter sp. KTW20L TaxID=2942210 RepID=UPI0020BFE820|nr:phosphatidylserine/phosphatidylglycerophosphate/cardiolipin synthase family protein [Altererythrobacter sp. KTW20L]MCL6251476.1 phosphatidylserine/phosphatidylglycerophosphate/cardiolipin synthase family protein [Altererythrobacter sp. KTW20L]